LSSEELASIHKHPIHGLAILERIECLEADGDFLRYAKVMAYSHHEKWDGTGYPLGLAGENIPILGRLMAIADSYHALTSERPYRKSFSNRQAMDIVIGESGTHFDPSLIDIFKEAAHGALS
jgi:HD-GYP domain-containing protein (c-di-GMP phosphodiesterase class II)